MPKIDYDKLQDSLEYIKIVCEEFSKDGCLHCPLGGKDGACRLKVCPTEWKPRHPDTDAFRVLE